MNSKFLRYCLYGYCSLIASLSCLAQGNSLGDQVKTPQPPFINKLPNFARYEMVLEPGIQGRGADPKAPPHFTKLAVTKTDATKLINATYSDGKARDIWERGGFILLIPPTRNDVFLYQAKEAHLDLSIGDEDFFDLGWLSASNYKSVVTYQGGKCYLFETGGGREARRALVDVGTKLPQMVSKGTTVWRYTYDPAPTAPLQFPPAFAKVWADAQEALRGMSGKSGPR